MVNDCLSVILTDKLTKKNLVPILLISLVIITSYVLPRDEYRTVLLYFILIPIFTFYRYEWRISIVYGIFLLILALVYISLGEGNFANQIITYGYWLLVVACFCLGIELLRKK